MSERPSSDRRLVPLKYNGSPLHTNQRLLGIPDSYSRISDYNRTIKYLILLIRFILQYCISLLGSCSTFIAHTP